MRMITATPNTVVVTWIRTTSVTMITEITVTVDLVVGVDAAEVDQER